MWGVQRDCPQSLKGGLALTSSSWIGPTQYTGAAHVYTRTLACCIQHVSTWKLTDQDTAEGWSCTELDKGSTAQELLGGEGGRSGWQQCVATTGEHEANTSDAAGDCALSAAVHGQTLARAKAD
eukprot:CAMPEP_0196668308 /NCGR_PEP_ID=MMETSP1086-20130531/65552_1 /TAXON_ID=77921 /ORGANISM="Cyanoptyche  gloeocystis , Strain SAG4.97" /LENGTH=123 /DNA_ID=CAMNT_0042005707 /DNA_START=352 /DNA_END=724 /DNA_ORIENTATION=-